ALVRQLPAREPGGERERTPAVLRLVGVARAEVGRALALDPPFGLRRTELERVMQVRLGVLEERLHVAPLRLGAAPSEIQRGLGEARQERRILRSLREQPVELRQRLLESRALGQRVAR